MTPCEELGWKVGDMFQVIISNTSFALHSIVVLQLDDRSDTPVFKLVLGQIYSGYELPPTFAGSNNCAFCGMNLVRKITKEDVDA